MHTILLTQKCDLNVGFKENNIKRLKAILVVTTVFILAIIAGCATGRTADLRDCGTLSVGVGLGLGAEVEVGALIHPAVGVMSVTTRVGFEDRNVLGVWDEREMFAPVLTAIAIAQKHKGKYDISYARSVEETRFPLASRSPKSQKAGRWINIKSVEHGRTLFNRATNLEVGVSLVLVSARVGINPLEIVDFALGFVGLDIAKDDPKTKDKEKPTTESTPTK